MSSVTLALIASLFLINTASAESEFFYHNNSRVELVWGEGDGFVLYYRYPRPGLPVSPDTVLFHGASPANGSIYGTAYIFSSRCGPIGYEVAGRFTDYGFVLEGAAPIRNSNCRLVRYEWNDNSHLYFYDY